MRLTFRCWGVAMGAALMGCQSSFADSPSLIERTTVLAIQAEPPEGPPGSPVTFQALVVTSQGRVSTASIHWALCTQPRDIAENNSVASECFSDENHLTSLGELPSDEPAHAQIPNEACAAFGSEPVPAAPGEPATRPADPDASGGYYVPIRASVLQETSENQAPSPTTEAVGHVRVRCALPSAPVDVAREYATRYENNQNPELESLIVVDSDGSPRSTYSPGETLEIEASWLPESAEDFMVYDVLDRRLRDLSETLQISWFITGGSVAMDRTTAENGANRARVTWTAPQQPEEIVFWAVLRDDRGGVGWKQLSLNAD